MSNKDPEAMTDAELLGEEALSTAKKFASAISSAAKMYFKILIGFLAIAIILVWIGISTGNSQITALGNLFRVIALGGAVLVFVIFSIPFSGNKYAKILLTCIATHLIITAVMYWSPMSITFESYFLLNIGLAVICLALWAGNPPMQIVGGIVTIAALGMLLFPTQAESVKRGIRGANVSKPAKFKHGEIPEIDFFDQSGNPLYKHSFDKTGKCVLFESGNYDSSLGEKLEPVTRALADRLQKDESLVSPRNFIGDTTSTATPSAGSYATAPTPVAVPEPPPAPAPYVPSPPATPPIPEPAPPAVENPTPAPAPSYKHEIPEKPQERTPVPRHKYATLFIGDSGAPDPGYSQDIASWFDSDGVSAADAFRHLSLSYRGTLLDSDRRRLGSLAENIVLVKCSTHPSPSRSRDRRYTCDLETKVIDTRTGEVIKTFPKSHSSSGSTDQTARESAITLALAKVKNNLP